MSATTVAIKIYEALKRAGAGIGNASIPIIQKTLDESHPEQGEQGEGYRMGEWQRCPLCEGHGQILADGFTSLVYQPCPTCQGNRIIQKPIIEGKLLSPPPEGQDERIKELEEEIEGLKEEVKRVSGVKVYEYTVEVDKWKEKVDHYKALAEAADKMLMRQHTLETVGFEWQEYLALKTPDREQRIIEGL